MLTLILFIPFAFSDVFADRFSNQQKSVHGLAIDEFPHHQVRAQYLASAWSLTPARSSLYTSRP
jgi:UDP-N-acetylglucosamine--dolichyl-phosphate N-acetylglucosaminephosphotransferase